MNQEVLATTPNDGAGLYSLLQQAVSNNAGKDQVSQLIDLVKFHDKREAERAFNKAFTKAQNEFPEIIRRGKSVNGNYATYPDIVKTIRPTLDKYGFGFRHKVKTNDKKISVTCVLSHELGHSEPTTITASPDDSGRKNEIQAVGSAVTYLKRYTLEAVTGIVSDNFDDDGSGASAVPPELISKANIKTIKTMLGKLPPDTEQNLLTWLGASKLEEIYAENAQIVINRLHKKIADLTKTK